MTEFCPQVVKLGKILKHPDPEVHSLEVTHVLGDYPVVIKKDSFREGDLASYIPLDSVLSDNPIFDFLKPSEKKRIRAKKLRGFYSQGLLVAAPESFKEGDSIQEVFGIEKYIYPEERIELGLELPEGFREGAGAKSGQNIAAPAWNPSKFDLDGLRKYGRYFEEGEEVVCTEKIDGCFAMYRHDGEKLWVKSRNFFKAREPQDRWWELALRENFEERLKDFPNYGFMGELYGQVTPFHYDCVILNNKIQSKFAVFDIFDFSKSKYLDYPEMLDVCARAGLNPVPELYRGPWIPRDGLYYLAEQDTKLVPTINKSTLISEGFVVRPIKEKFVYPVGRLILKLKSERYNLVK